MDSNQAFAEPVTLAPESQHVHHAGPQTPPSSTPDQRVGTPEQRRRRQKLATLIAAKPTSTAKSVTLTFSSAEELAVHDVIAKAAQADDRSVNQFIVRVLMGKETMPSESSVTD